MNTQVFAFPSTDLALLHGGKVDFRFMGFNLDPSKNLVWTDLGAAATIAQTFPAGVATFSGATLTAGAGSAIGTISLTSTNPAILDGAPFLVRVRVFDSVDKLFVSPTKVTLFTNRDDRVLSVYAMMKLGTTTTCCDITSHPQLVFASSDTTVVDVDRLGRLKTTANAGTATITVSVIAGGGAAHPVTVTVTVVASPATRLIKRIRSATVASPRALLFLSEGFTTDRDFNTLVDKIVDHLLQHVPPFSLAPEAFDVYRGFFASDDDGLTLCPPAGPGLSPAGVTPDLSSPLPMVYKPTPTQYGLAELIGEVGLAHAGAPTSVASAKTAWVNSLTRPNRLTAGAFSGWSFLAKDLGLYAPKSIAFGLRRGSRLSGPETVPPSPTATTSIEGAFYQPRLPINTISWDPRRCPDLTNPANAISDPRKQVVDAFLSSLAVDAAHPNLGARWASTGADYGLVCFVINDDTFAGTQFPGGVGATAGVNDFVKPTPVAGMPGLWDHTPVWPNATTAANQRLGFLSPAIDALTDRVAHEFTHAFGMGDEYGGTPVPEHTSAAIAIATAPNLETQWTVTVVTPPPPLTTATPLNASKLRWAALPRVEQSATPLTVTASGSKVAIKLPKPGATTPDWSRVPAGRTVQLRALRRRKIAPSAQLVVVSFDTATDELTTTAPASASTTDYTANYGNDAALVLIRNDASGHPMMVIDPLVVADLATHGALNGPTAPNDPGPDRANPRAIAGISSARLDFRLIGAYVGGATYNTEILRPCGACKLRSVLDVYSGVTQISDFCFICMYAFIEDTAIAKLGALDARYP